MYPASKTPDIAAINDELGKSRPSDVSDVTQYVCLSAPFDGIPQETIVAFSIAEYGSAESLIAESYPMTLAGATIRRIPILEVPLGTGAATEEKFRS
jgi:hypothetical protein